MVEPWGGIADRRTRGAWNRDTAAVMFSFSSGPMGQLTLALGRVVGA